MKNQILKDILQKQDNKKLTNLFQNGELAEIAKIDLADFLAKVYLNHKEVNVQFIGALISYDAVKLDSYTQSGNTPLMMAIHLENYDLVKLLINENLDINTVDKKGISAFMWAVALGNESIVNLLIEKGVNVYAKATFEIDSMQPVAFDKNKLQIISMEKEDTFYETVMIEHELSAFSFSCHKYNPNIMKVLIRLGFDVNEYVVKNDLVFDFIMNPNSYNFYMKSEYAKAGTLINAYDVADNRSRCFYHTAISEACINNDTEVVQLLLEHGANNYKLDDMLTACDNFNFKIIKKLIEFGMNVNEQSTSYGLTTGGTALQRLCANSYVNPYSNYLPDNQDINKREMFEIINFLIEKGADVNLGSPLMAACIFKDFLDMSIDSETNNNFGDINLQVVELLIKKGANVNYTLKSNGKSILAKVCENKSNGYEIAKILISNGADVNFKDFNKNTPLMLLNDELLDKYSYLEDDEGNWKPIKFEKSTSEQILELLLNNGADINARNKIGMTALMKYALEGKTELVKLLLEHGADINIKSELTAFDLASDNDSKELIKSSQNNEPQKLVHILSNFTVDKPVKYTTHDWDFGDLRKSEYKNFEGYMDAVKKQFENFADELKTLSPNLYKKIYTFLLDESPEENYSWSQKVDINIGWSSLEGLKEHCDNNMKPDTFRLKESFIIGNQEITTFGEVINFFKQEIEVRNDNKSIKYLDKSLEELFVKQRKKMRGLFNMDLSASKLGKQFYTDTEKLDIVLDSIFKQIKSNKQQELDTIRVISSEPSDNSIEIRIVHVGSFAPLNASHLLDEAKDGDFASIKENLQNLCDWSCENSFEGQGYRVNYLHSNNVKDIEPLENTPEGFTHIMRFYKR